MAKQKYTILIVDDDPAVQAACSALSENYEQVVFFNEPDYAKAFANVEKLRPDLVLLDVYMGDKMCFDALDMLHDRGLKIPAIIMTGSSDMRIAVHALKSGAEDFIVKPLDPIQVESAVQRALRNYDLRRQMDILQERLQEEEQNELLGNSETMQHVKQFADIFAQTDDTTVLILGESGTGKELMARYIHQRSPRSAGPFVSVNCGAIPRELAENELFGYERGAFTGATEKVKLGRFEMAHRGTILLDEVGELSYEMQIKLLRVLQERSFYRLGGAKEVSVNVRVIAATNRNLEKMVEEGKFREDLFFRLNVGTVMMPPLRERRGDIMLLATAFLNEFNKKFGKRMGGFTSDAIEALESYEWKGNVREMRNAIERITLLESGEMITKDSIRFLRVGMGSQSATGQPLASGHTLNISKQGATLEAVMRDLLEQTLKLAEGNQTQAAKMLGITRAVLKTRMEQSGLAVEAD
ncbi:MAG: sigma-54-dependent Fis family transcriptional regulator [Ignavibacteria bacterium]|nr:sigma-54-dependent Fis family transcriptional regulator [Ignavibacteria bacterium]MBL7989940.1 sigma-54-dependent Fis family transcriptional regulator [Candidatus Kapabacteria bacterium]